MSISNFLLETFPQYIQDQMDKTAEGATTIEKCYRLNRILETLRDIKLMAQGMSQKLRTQEGFLLFPKILSENYIIEFKDIKSCNLRKNVQIYFLAWTFANLEQIDQYQLQTYFRMICMISHFECKKYFETLQIDFISKFESDLNKIFLLVCTQARDFKVEVDAFFLKILQYSGSKNNQFVNYMVKFCQERNLKSCIEYLDSQKSAVKMTDEKRRGFKSFKESTVPEQKPILRQTKSFAPQKKQCSFQETKKEKEIPRNSMVSRPSLTVRTIKDGINHRYKREKEHIPERRVQSEYRREEQLQNIQMEQTRFPVISSWNSDYLIPETP